MVLKDQLIEGLHSDMPRIVLIADNFSENLRSDSFELWFGKSWALENIGEESEPEVDVFLQYARRRGREIFVRLGAQRTTDKIDLFGQLFGRSGCGAFIEETGD